MAAALWILGFSCLGYYLFLRLSGMDFAVVWLSAGAAASIWACVLVRAPFWAAMLPRWVKMGAGFLLLLGILLFAVLEGLIIYAMGGSPRENLDYIIVLGAQVRGDRPSRALRERIETAASYLRRNPSATAILSGGQGPGEDMAEAQCMRRALEEMGIEGNRLVLEERSTSTWENLEFSAGLASVRERQVGLVTQDFHIYRSIKLAKSQGYAHIYGIAAPSDPRFQLHFMVREAFALVKEKLAGNI